MVEEDKGLIDELAAKAEAEQTKGIIDGDTGLLDELLDAEFGAEQTPLRLIHVNYDGSKIFDFRVDNAPRPLQILQKNDQIPAEILLYMINGHGLTGYLTGEVTRQAISYGTRSYYCLDFLAVGEAGKAREFTQHMRHLISDGDGRAILTRGSATKYSRVFKIDEARSSSGVLYFNAVSNFVLRTKSHFLRPGSSKIRLCVLTDEAYKEMLG